jgi:sirohydrochlorin ferrochelatase
VTNQVSASAAGPVRRELAREGAPGASADLAPVLVACAHGTREPAGRRVVGSLVAALRAARPGLPVAPAFVDVQPPRVGTVVDGLGDRGRRAVVVPLLLSGGYHVHVDVAEAVAGSTAVAAAALGPDDRLTALLLDRLRESGATPDDAVVLAAAGSSDARAVADVERVRDEVRARWGGPVTTGYGAKATPTVRQAIRAARAEHPDRRVVIASYLLAPGFFHDRLLAAGADLVSAPLGRPGEATDPRLVQVVLDRYDAAVVHAR